MPVSKGCDAANGFGKGRQDDGLSHFFSAENCLCNAMLLSVLLFHIT